MIKNYFLTAIRTLEKNKIYVIINVLGLGLALACCITSYLILAFNMEFDDLHSYKGIENTYVIHTHFEAKPDYSNRPLVRTPIKLPEQAALSVSGIDGFTRFAVEKSSLEVEDDTFSEEVAFADDSFLEIFNFPWVTGNPESFHKLDAIFLSERMAQKLFKGKNPLSETLELHFANDQKLSVIVAGIFKDIPQNTTFQFDLLIRFEHFTKINQINDDSWNLHQGASTFLKLDNGINVNQVNSELQQYVDLCNKNTKGQRISAFTLEPFKSNYTEDEVHDAYVNTRIGIEGVVTFLFLGLLILLIACFNLTNTSIALTVRRLKEVGIRKVVGASRSQIRLQFLLETVLIIALAIVAGLIMSQYLVPAFSEMWDLRYGLDDISKLNLVVALVGLMFLASLLAGIYPAFFNSRFEPTLLLKGGVKINGTNFFTNTLTVIQFCLCTVVLMAGIVFTINTTYQEGADFGYEGNDVVVIPVKGDHEYMLLKSLANQMPKVNEVGATTHGVGWTSYGMEVSVDTQVYQARYFNIGENYFDVMGMRLSSGRLFHSNDQLDNNEIIVNQQFIDQAEIAQFGHDRTIMIEGERKKIIGIVDNHLDNFFRSHMSEPAIYHRAKPDEVKYMIVKCDPDDRSIVKAGIGRHWKAHITDRPFECYYYEDLTLGKIRDINRNLKQIFLFLTVLACILSASGIFALASLNTERRTKEIGIRKVLGASSRMIVKLINREFLLLLLLGGAIGSVGGYYFTYLILDIIFSYRVPVGPLPIALAVITIVGIGWLTTSLTISNKASSNPVDTLRDE